MADVIMCPSELSGRIHGMRVREELALADRKLAKSGGQTDELPSTCWEETLDVGVSGPAGLPGDHGGGCGVAIGDDRITTAAHGQAVAGVVRGAPGQPVVDGA